MNVEAPPYVAYARMDALYELAQPLTDSASELNFILISQVKELLFRIMYTEASGARAALRADCLDAACLALGRTVRVQRVLLAAWDVVAAMSPDEFMTFRHILRSASGTQSFMYRALEFCLGNKDPRVARSTSRHEILNSELAAPSLYDEALRFLSRRNWDIPDAVLGRDWRAPYEPHPGVQAAWLAIYRSPASHEPEHRLAEALTDVSYQFSLWRSTHLLVVERMLGGKPGTGGTSGLGWLRSVSEHRFFPELWQVRTVL